MEYRELKNRATGGKWKFCSRENRRGQLLQPAVATEEGSPILIATAFSEGSDNVRLSAHEHNHFNLLLEALENLIRLSRVMLSQNHREIVEAEKVLREAKEVKE